MGKKKGVKDYAKDRISDSTLNKVKNSTPKTDKKTAKEIVQDGAKWAGKIADSGVLTQLTDMTKGEALNSYVPIDQQQQGSVFYTKLDETLTKDEVSLRRRIDALK